MEGELLTRDEPSDVPPSFKAVFWGGERRKDLQQSLREFEFESEEVPRAGRGSSGSDLRQSSRAEMNRGKRGYKKREAPTPASEGTSFKDRGVGMGGVGNASGSGRVQGEIFIVAVEWGFGKAGFPSSEGLKKVKEGCPPPGSLFSACLPSAHPG